MIEVKTELLGPTPRQKPMVRCRQRLRICISSKEIIYEAIPTGVGRIIADTCVHGVSSLTVLCAERCPNNGWR